MTEYPLTNRKNLLVPQLNVEGELLLDCLSPQINDTTVKRIQTLLTKKIDWEFFLALAQKHRVMAIVYRSLNGIDSDKIPSFILKQLRNNFLTNSRRNLLITNELFRLLELFEHHNIRVIPYKGTVLAGCVYGKLSLRQVYDIDVIVDRDDADKIQKLLLSQNYQLRENFDNERSYFNGDNQIEIDVHWAFTPLYFPLKVNFDNLWQNRQSVLLGGKTIETLSSEDLLFLLCIQIAKDCWERKQKIEYLAKVADIAQLIAKTPELNWSEFIAKGQNQDTSRIIHFALILARDLFTVTLPTDITAKIDRDKVAIWLAKQVCSNLFTEEDQTPSASRNSLLDINLRIKQLVFYWNLRKTWHYKTMYLASIFNLITTLKSSK